MTRTTTPMETRPLSDEQLAQDLRSAELPNGPALAAFLAAGIGSATLGFLTSAAQASKPVKEFLTLNTQVGPLSGKTVYAVAIWLASWVILGLVMRGRGYPSRPFFIATFVLLAIGLVGTFPLFYDRLSP